MKFWFLNSSMTMRSYATVLIALLITLHATPLIAAPGDLVLKRKEGAAEGFPVSVFPHWIHRINYRCDACHTRLFQMEAGTAEISMEDINTGRACGACHNGQKAFGTDFSSCNRCHRTSATE